MNSQWRLLAMFYKKTRGELIDLKGSRDRLKGQQNMQ